MREKRHITEIADYLGTVNLTEIYNDFEIASGYCCDMLSYALVNIDQGTCWITIMNSMNVIAVAQSTGCRCIILADGIRMSEDVLLRAKRETISVLSSSKSAFILAGELYAYLHLHQE